ncbi:hypothetical protein [Streptomyces sp. SAJ15]|uniref:hypothetical protein n=1 Tax=Streptomyces sp. SAJ15 TaxID=2011095 RepID=UPI0011846D1A|nr:hypothetical protein [Streptomyces sp. SAJ15]TVL89753.1 hypothetical protein CD790_25490 [Streptomyces sp. SAJ15]
MTDQPIGQLIDTIGVTADLDQGDLVTDALVILKVLQPDGSIALSIGTTDTRDWITQTGLLHAALEAAEGRHSRTGDDE